MDNENVGRTILGRETLHSSVRRERVANAPPRRGPGRSKRSKVGSSSQTQADIEMPQMSSPHAASASQPPPHIASSSQPPSAGTVQDGYAGGPSDMSLLPRFDNHIAAKIWNGQDRETIPRVIYNAKRIIDLVLPPDVEDTRWFGNIIRASGLHPLLKTNYGQVDHGLLIAFSERWQAETSSFHLPIGEMTITLDDVSCLLHIPFDGCLMCHESLTVVKGADYLVRYLGLNGMESLAECAKIKSARISYS